WFADALRQRQVARQRQRKQLAPGSEWRILALHPGLLGGQSNPRRHLDAAESSIREVNSNPIWRNREMAMSITLKTITFAAAVVGVATVNGLATQALSQEANFRALANLPFAEGRPTK